MDALLKDYDFDDAIYVNGIFPCLLPFATLENHSLHPSHNYFAEEVLRLKGQIKV